MKDLTDITVILDRSGSMAPLRADTIGGFNTFLDEQKKLPDPAVLSVVQFDHEYAVVYAGRNLQHAPPLTEETYVPRGETALFDAIGRTVMATGARLSALPEAARPKRVVVVIMTDGFENASHEYTREMIHALLTEQREKYSWDFVFIGANQDAFATGAAIGAKYASNYVASAVGTADAYTGMSRGISNLRSGGKYDA